MVKRTENSEEMTPLSKGDVAEAGGDRRMNHRDRDDDFADRNTRSSREFNNRDWDDANAPTDAARRRAFRERYAQSHLPNLPPKAGWHRYWASTSHPTNTPQRMLTVGYRFITQQQLQDEGSVWHPEDASVKDAAVIDGHVRWREMIAMECTEEDYQDYMREFHHDLPRDMARDIFEPLADMAERVAGRGNVNFTEDFKEVQRFRRAPKQFE